MAAYGLPKAPTRLYHYNPETMLAPDTTVVVVGPRGSGKTVFMKYVMFCMRDRLDLVTFFCPSRDVRQEFEAFMPKSHIHADFSKARLKQICEAQAKLANEAPGKGVVGTGGVPLRNLGLVLDDCMAKKAVFECETVRAIMNNGRHDNIFFMNGVQYIMAVPKEQRSQIDVAVCFPHAGAYLKNVNDNLMGDAFEDEAECARAFATLKDHECLVFDGRAKRRNKGAPFLFYCKAMYDLPDFMVGCDFFWRMYYRYMVRSKVDARKEILNTLAMAKGEMVAADHDPDSAAAAAIAATTSAGMQTPGPHIVVRMPADATVPLVTGPAAAAGGGHASHRGVTAYGLPLGTPVTMPLMINPSGGGNHIHLGGLSHGLSPGVPKKKKKKNKRKLRAGKGLAPLPLHSIL